MPKSDNGRDTVPCFPPSSTFGQLINIFALKANISLQLINVIVAKWTVPTVHVRSEIGLKYAKISLQN